MADGISAALNGRGGAGILPGAGMGAVAWDGGFTLREARDSDADAVIELVRAVWSEYPGKLLDPARDMPELLSPQSTYRAWHGRFWVIVAEDGTLIGTVALKPAAEPTVVELQKLYVAKDA